MRPMRHQHVMKFTIPTYKVLLYEETGKDKYKQDIKATFQDWMPGGNVPYSPKGLAFRSQWGSLRYACKLD